MDGLFLSPSRFMVKFYFPLKIAVQRIFGFDINHCTRSGKAANALHFNPVRLDLVVESLAANTEAFGRFELVPAGFI